MKIANAHCALKFFPAHLKDAVAQPPTLGFKKFSLYTRTAKNVTRLPIQAAYMISQQILCGGSELLTNDTPISEEEGKRLNE